MTYSIKARTCVVQWSVLYCTELVLYSTSTVLHHTLQYLVVQYRTVPYCTSLYCTVPYCTILVCTVLYWNILFCNKLYCTKLYFNELHWYLLKEKVALYFLPFLPSAESCRFWLHWWASSHHHDNVGSKLIFTGPHSFISLSLTLKNNITTPPELLGQVWVIPWRWKPLQIMVSTRCGGHDLTIRPWPWGSSQ